MINSSYIFYGIFLDYLEKRAWCIVHILRDAHFSDRQPGQPDHRDVHEITTCTRFALATVFLRKMTLAAHYCKSKTIYTFPQALGSLPTK